MENPGELSLAAIESLGAAPAPATLFTANAIGDHSLTRLKETLEREYILHHLTRLEGDTTALSKLLGVSRKHF